MSELCLVNLKEHMLKEEQLKDFSRRIVEFSLDNELGVYFNSLSFDNSLIREAKILDYFLLTDNFYCDSCEFISTIGLVDGDLDKFKQNFLNKFKFFEDLFKIIFEYDINIIEVFLSEGVGDCLEDYDEVETSPESFLVHIFENILKYKDEMAYEIPNLKMVVHKSFHDCKI